MLLVSLTMGQTGCCVAAIFPAELFTNRAQPLATSPDNLSWVPRTHIVKGKNQGLHIVLWPLPQDCGIHKIDTQYNNNNNNNNNALLFFSDPWFSLRLLLISQLLKPLLFSKSLSISPCEILFWAFPPPINSPYPSCITENKALRILLSP